MGAAWTDTGLVFTAEDGSALVPDHVSRLFAPLLNEATRRRSDSYPVGRRSYIPAPFRPHLAISDRRRRGRR